MTNPQKQLSECCNAAIGSIVWTDPPYPPYDGCLICGKAITKNTESPKPAQLAEEPKGFIPKKPWSICTGDDCEHLSHQGYSEKCKFCDGTGEILIKYNLRNWIKDLASKGFTYREIMAITGIQSTNTIAYHLKKST